VAQLRADLRHVTIQRDILKKALAIVGQTSPHHHAMIRAMISDPGNTHRLTDMCQTLEVSRSGYYDHALKAQRPRRQQDQAIAAKLAHECGQVFQIARFQKLDSLKPRAGISESGSPADWIR
jgi:hypothetical protein